CPSTGPTDGCGRSCRVPGQRRRVVGHGRQFRGGRRDDSGLAAVHPVHLPSIAYACTEGGVMDILGLGYVGIESPNVEEWSEYGPQVLGFGLAPSERGTVLLRMDERHHRIAVRHGERDQLSYLGWELRNRPAFFEALKVLDRA